MASYLRVSGRQNGHISNTVPADSRFLSAYHPAQFCLACKNWKQPEDVWLQGTPGAYFWTGHDLTLPLPYISIWLLLCKKGEKKEKDLWRVREKKKKKGKERKIPQDKRDEKFKAVLKQLVKAGAQADLKSEQWESKWTFKDLSWDFQSLFDNLDVHFHSFHWTAANRVLWAALNPEV